MTVSPVAYTDPYRSHLAAKPGSAETEISFADILDVINPLQHIPGLNLVYREITGDKIASPAAIMGGALYGGLIGFAGAMAAAAFEALAGETPGDMLLGLVRPDQAAPELAAQPT